MLCTYGDAEDDLGGREALFGLGNEPVKVHGKGESFMDRRQFFDEFFTFISAQVKAIKVDEAAVPLIKIEIDKVQIDMLLCVKLPWSESLTSVEHTACRASLLSILGFQCSQIFKEVARNLAPKAHEDSSVGEHVFSRVVQLLKQFARNKSIYGSNQCYLNGISLQIMTLFVMELLYED